MAVIPSVDKSGCHKTITGKLGGLSVGLSVTNKDVSNSTKKFVFIPSLKHFPVVYAKPSPIEMDVVDVNDSLRIAVVSTNCEVSPQQESNKR